jgi:ribosome recycling factor
MLKELLFNTEELMKKSIDKLKKEFASLRTSRANATLLDGIKVNCYNSMMPINQVAGISVPDARTIEIRPWDVAVLDAIEKAIFSSSLGITPANDGKTIRLKIPPLTEERRKELVKYAHKVTEDFRVSVRNERHQAIELVKKAEKDKKISKDDLFKTEEQMQKLTDRYIKIMDETLLAKEKEIMSE